MRGKGEGEETVEPMCSSIMWERICCFVREACLRKTQLPQGNEEEEACELNVHGRDSCPTFCG